MLKKIPFSLQLFADGGDAGGDNGGSTEIGDSGNTSSEAKVIYGKVPDDNAEEKAEDNADDTAKNTEKEEKPEAESFEDLIKGKYKAEFSSKVKSILDGRFPKVREMENTIAKQSEVLEELYGRYEVDNPDSLLQKILADEAYWEQLAEKEGMSVSQIKNVKRMEREHQKILKEAEINRQDLEARKKAEKWFNEGTEVQKDYPDFNLFEELENENFKILIQNGTPMKVAYEVVHHNEHISGVAKKAAQEASRKTAEQIKSRGMRPKENIGALSPGVVVKSDPSQFTKEDFKNIRKRSAQGEKFIF